MTGNQVLHSLTREPTTLQIESLTQGILKLAERAQVDSSTFVAAIADTLAIVAATLDREAMPQHLDDRLGEFNKRVEEKYAQVLAVMEKKKWSTEN